MQFTLLNTLQVQEFSIHTVHHALTHIVDNLSQFHSSFIQSPYGDQVLHAVLYVYVLLGVCVCVSLT